MNITYDKDILDRQIKFYLEPARELLDNENIQELINNGRFDDLFSTTRANVLVPIFIKANINFLIDKAITKNMFMGVAITSIEVPENIREIHNSAFYDCKELKSVTLPKDIIFINDNAFMGCEQLKEFIIHDSIANYNRDDLYKLLRTTKVEKVIFDNGTIELWK